MGNPFLRTVLLVEDEAMIREAVASYFEKKGNLVYTAETGKEALQIFGLQKIDLVILDLMLPDMPGEEVCIRIRKSSRIPILMLTAKTMEADVLQGLSIGADDYIRKPFSLKELYARTEVILRRVLPEKAGDSVVVCRAEGSVEAELEIDFEKRLVRKQGDLISLTPIEWKILEAMVNCPQKVFTREELISIAFDADFDGYDRVVDTHIKNLRRKLETDSRNPVYIQTVHGIGYRFGGDSR